MPSLSHREWSTTRANDLDEIEQAHAAIGGTGPGRRYATQQINRAYTMLLAAQFQGFSRDLHGECIGHLMMAIAPPAALEPIVRDEFLRARQLDRGNAQPDSLGADFGRLGVDLWAEVDALNPSGAAARALLKTLNRWRNAIAHQDFDPAKLGGTATLGLAQVRRWRTTCGRLARDFDEVMRRHLQAMTGSSPW